MKHDTLLKEWLAEENATFSGWDFSRLKGRLVEPEIPWDYREFIESYRNPTDRLLDMGTGGGEFLLTLSHPFRLTSVTEGYEPNVVLCQEKLSPLGIIVKAIAEDDKILYEDSAFDLVLNRHDSFDASEVFRVLRRGGIFITQQVGGKDGVDLAKKLIPDFTPLFPEHDLEHNLTLLQRAGFVISESGEAIGASRFTDISAVVYFAKLIQWTFPGFAVKKSFERLLSLQNELEETGEITMDQHRFYLIARKPE